MIKKLRTHLSDPAAGRRRIVCAGRGTTFLSVLPLAFCLAFIWPFGGGGRTIHMMSGTETPAARGSVTIDTGDNGNTTVDVKAHALAAPNSLMPAENVYVVWIKAPGHAAQNQGEMLIGQHESGEIHARTPFKRFSVFITAEQNAEAQIPQGPKVLSADVSRG